MPISLGAKLSRHHLEIYQTGEQTETVLNGLTLLGGEQVGDMHSTIALTQPYGTTRQLHKCIVGDRAHGIFNGKVFVPQQSPDDGCRTAQPESAAVAQSQSGHQTAARDRGRQR